MTFKSDPTILLGPGDYNITIQDRNLCTFSTTVTIFRPAGISGFHFERVP